MVTVREAGRVELKKAYSVVRIYNRRKDAIYKEKGNPFFYAKASEGNMRITRPIIGRLELSQIYFPKKFIGKRIRIFVEVVK